MVKEGEINEFSVLVLDACLKEAKITFNMHQKIKFGLVKGEKLVDLLLGIGRMEKFDIRRIIQGQQKAWFGMGQTYVSSQYDINQKKLQSSDDLGQTDIICKVDGKDLIPSTRTYEKGHIKKLISKNKSKKKSGPKKEEAEEKSPKKIKVLKTNTKEEVFKDNTIFKKRYIIKKMLGKSQLSTVYLAYDIKEKQLVALKVMNRRGSKEANTKAAMRLVREVRAMKSLNHENIVKVFDLDSFDDDIPFMVMEYVDGLNFKDLQPEGLPYLLDVKEIILFFWQITKALQYAHNKGVIHRDIKPANIMVPRGQRTVKILDFNLVLLTGDNATGSQGQSRVGTPAFQAPEQQNNPSEIDARSDVFSVGVTLYKVLTGKYPFFDYENNQIDYNIKPANPSELNKSLNKKIDDICKKAIQLQKEFRYKSMAEMNADLVAYLEGGNITDSRVTSYKYLKYWVKKNRLLTAAFIFLVFCLLMSSIIIYYLSNKKITKLMADNNKIEKEKNVLDEENKKLHKNLLAEQKEKKIIEESRKFWRTNQGKIEIKYDNLKKKFKKNKFLSVKVLLREIASKHGYADLNYLDKYLEIRDKFSAKEQIMVYYISQINERKFNNNLIDEFIHYSSENVIEYSFLNMLAYMVYANNCIENKKYSKAFYFLKRGKALMKNKAISSLLYQWPDFYFYVGLNYYNKYYYQEKKQKYRKRAAISFSRSLRYGCKRPFVKNIIQTLKNSK